MRDYKYAKRSLGIKDNFFVPKQHPSAQKGKRGNREMRDKSRS